VLAAVLVSRSDPGFAHNGALAGLVAVCSGSDVMHPLGAAVVGGVAGAMFVFAFELCQYRWKIDDVLGVWPLHGLCGAWGGIAAGIFGSTALGGRGGVSILSQVAGTLGGITIALVGGFVVYGVIKAVIGIRLDAEDEYLGADLALHNIAAYPEEELRA
jgi:Amt family ammonium transporter